MPLNQPPSEFDTEWPFGTIDPRDLESTIATAKDPEAIDGFNAQNNSDDDGEPLKTWQPSDLPQPRRDSQQLNLKRSNSSTSHPPSLTTASSSASSLPPPIEPTPSPGPATSTLHRRRGRPQLYPPRASNTTSKPLPPTQPSPRKSGRPLDLSNPSNPITRTQNRLAAARFRARNDAYIDSLTTQAAALEGRNAELKGEERTLREEVLGLKGGILDVARSEAEKGGVCECGVVERYLEMEMEKMGKGRGKGKNGEHDGVGSGDAETLDD